MKTSQNKRIVITAGAKGGVGKTAASNAVVDYYDTNGVPTTKIDCDCENRRKGGFSSYFAEALKLDNHGERGLDEVISAAMDSPNHIAVVDLGAGSGAATFGWFNQMGQMMVELGVKVTLVCPITSNPAAITGVFNWAGHLGTSVEYLVVANLKDGDDLSYYHATEQGKVFARECRPVLVTMAKRVSQIQHELDNRNLSVRQALEVPAEVRGPILNRIIDQARLRGYLNGFNRELEKAKDLLLP